MCSVTHDKIEKKQPYWGDLIIFELYGMGYK